jgi:flagellar basal-body rod modification protein FlgD
MSIPAASPLYTSSPEAVNRVPVQTLKQDDFLKVLVAQMTTQDPLNPMKDADFLGQMAQFSALEQTRSMSQEMSKLRSEQERYQASALLGHRVEISKGEGLSESGVVTAIEMEGGSPMLVVNNEKYRLSEVLRVWQRPS